MEPVQARLEVWMSRPGLVRSAIGCKARGAGSGRVQPGFIGSAIVCARTGFAFTWFAMRDDDKTLQGGLICRVQGWRLPAR